MKILFIECNMGVAGDMLMGALLELVDEKEKFIDEINQLNIPKVRVAKEKTSKCGITGTHIHVYIDGKEEQINIEETHHFHDHNDMYEHHHEEHKHHHEHSSINGIKDIVDNMNISEKIKEDVLNVYDLIAQAESKAHGRNVEEIHFHEVGMMDAIADITGCCMLLRKINPDKVVVSPVVTGYGHVHCAHGIVPVPAPATAYLLEGIPNKAGNVEGELCTPTGAALIRYFAQEFNNRPEMITEKTGYGMGTKDFPVANCVRTFLGDTSEEDETVYELCCNLDDMTPEQIAHAKKMLLDNGALDVYTTSVNMKKGRDGIVLSVLCKPMQKEDMARLIFKHTSTIGIREYKCERMTLKRRIVEVDTKKWGTIHLKKSLGYGVEKVKIEYEDLNKIANSTGQSLKEINDELMKEID